ncbi:MAG: hypothetical protein K2H20_01130 [Bacilli bacterium]|nr:hypothetical protein [Bacilli bacterium]
MEKGMVELTPVQASAYWCVNMIRNKVREINTNRNVSSNEVGFLSLFYSYTDKEWRNLYLELVEHFKEITDNERYDFFIDTEVGEHDVLNAIISMIIKEDVPDISLSSNSENDSIIYIKNDSASVWYMSCGDMPLSLKYEPDYVLTGDQDELELYNVLVATLAMIVTLDSGFRSISKLRERFCEEYKKANGLEDELESIVVRFNLAYKRASERGLVTGSDSSKSFFTSIGLMDISALEDYMDKGHHYAEVVLEREDVFPLPVSNELKKEN